MTDKTIPVTMPDWMWGRLANIAEHRHIKVADLIAFSLQKTLNDDTGRLGQLAAEVARARAKATRPGLNRMTDERVKKLVEMHAKNYPDSAIAAALDISPQTVRRQRDKLGLPPTGRRSNQWWDSHGNEGHAA